MNLHSSTLSKIQQICSWPYTVIPQYNIMVCRKKCKRGT